MMKLHVFCDESTHLPNDGCKSMVLGAISCPISDLHRVSEQIRDIKRAHFGPSASEVKWTKASHSNLAMYMELVAYFFAHESLQFRAVIATGKERLDHTAFRQTHDDWYYKMYYLLLLPLLGRKSELRIFLDIKDSRSQKKVVKLEEILRNKARELNIGSATTIQNVRSHEVELLQIADILIGSINYSERSLKSSSAKVELRDLIRQLSGLTLTSSTAPGRSKMDIFRWAPQETEA